MTGMVTSSNLNQSPRPNNANGTERGRHNGRGGEFRGGGVRFGGRRGTVWGWLDGFESVRHVDCEHGIKIFLLLTRCRRSLFATPPAVMAQLVCVQKRRENVILHTVVFWIVCMVLVNSSSIRIPTIIYAYNWEARRGSSFWPRGRLPGRL